MKLANRFRLLGVFFAVLIVISVSITASAADRWVTVDGIVGGQICFDSSTGTITACETFVTSADIPEEISGVKVTAIGGSAFDNCTWLTSVDIPDSVTSIGSWAFNNCTSLASVDIGDSVTSIDGSAFDNCTSLASVDIPDSVTSIGSDAFYCCRSLTSVDIGDSVTSIGSGAFYGCTDLTGFTVDANNKYYSNDTRGALFDKSKTKLIQYPVGNTAASYSIPSSVTSIGSDAFYNCTSLTSVDIGDSVTSIGSYAFYGCSSLKKVYYNGTAAQWEKISIADGNDAIKNAEKNFKVGSGGTSTTVSKLVMTGFSPKNVCCEAGTKATITFNLPVTAKKGNISFHDTNGAVTDLSVLSSAVTVSGNTVSFALPESLKGTTYYVTIDSGAFASGSTIFYGLTDKTTWVFSIKSAAAKVVAQAQVAVNEPLVWAKSGFIFTKDDDSLPPYPDPDASDDEYIDVICAWAANNNVALTREQVKKLLNKTVYLPAQDSNGSTVMLGDKNITVKQAVMDIIFIKNLKPYVIAWEEELKEVTYWKGSGKNANPMNLEKDLYADVIDWYGQIDAYLESRNGNSNIFYSAGAGFMYQYILTAASTLGGDVYSYSKPIITATLNKKIEYSSQINGLSAYEDYKDFSNAVKDVGTAYAAGKAVYTADCTGNKSSVLKFGANLFVNGLKTSNFTFLKNLASAYSDFSSTYGAVKNCMFLGSSIGLFPMVIDLHNNLSKKIDNSMGAFFLIGDYYIRVNHPTLYDKVYDQSTGLPKNDQIGNSLICEEYIAGHNNDNVLKNWCGFLTSNIYNNLDKDVYMALRYDLVNYALLMEYAKDYDSDTAIKWFVSYLSAEANKGKTTTAQVSCPVTVKVYSKTTGELVASLSSEDKSITENEYFSMYLMGEDNETKCFVVNSDEYRLEIIPQTGSTGETMDVLIVSENEDGTTDSSYYESITLTEGMTYNIDSIAEGTMKSGDDEVSKTEAIPLTGILLSLPEKLAKDSQYTAGVQLQPVCATGVELAWSSSNTNVVAVTDGVLTAVADGTAEITVSCGEASASATVRVYTPATSLTLNVSELSMVAGESTAVTAVTDGTGEIQWTSSRESVVSVSDGSLYALREGTSVITAELDGCSAEVTVTVYAGILETKLYQSDADGMQLKVDITNCSGTVLPENTKAIVAIYKGSRLVKTQMVTVPTDPSDSITVMVPIDGYDAEAEYTAKVFAVGTDMKPIIDCTVFKLLTDSDSEE